MGATPAPPMGSVVQVHTEGTKPCCSVLSLLPAPLAQATWVLLILGLDLSKGQTQQPQPSPASHPPTTPAEREQ